MSQCFEVPERSCFNLTHYARLVPESHIVFVTPPGCSRIIRLSAIEEGINERFTIFNLEPSDVIQGSIENILIDGTEATLDRLTAEGRRPKAMLVFVSCVDSFIGTDHSYVMDELRAFAPDVIFMDLAMDPINRETLPPLLRIHKSITALFEKTGSERSVTWLGSWIPPAEDDPLALKLAQKGIASRHLLQCETLDELRQLGNSAAFIASTKLMPPVVRELKARFGTPYYNLFNPADPDSMSEEELLAI
ncbi:MAG: nitrogenase component 1 [Clostridiales bacterium]|nr:nitrogenase component 1 [Clostridiales bacterium]